MSNNFDMYKESKKCLYLMIGQFFSCNIPKDHAILFNINTEDNLSSTSDYVEIYTHSFTSEGLLAWDYLGFDKDIVEWNELKELIFNLKNEQFNGKTDYYEKYLKNSILLIDMIKKYYGKKMPQTEVKQMNIPYDEELDEFDDEINLCFHLFEGAGESAWNFFDIEEPIVGESIFDNKRKILCNELLKINRSKKLIKKR